MIDRVSERLPYSVEQVFDLAADIERYPEFLKGWRSARILARGADCCTVEQELGLGPIRLRFTSEARLWRPERIEVSSGEPPFQRFSLSWLIVPDGSGSRVRVIADFQMRSSLLQHTVNALLPLAIDDLIGSFTARARALYDAAPGTGR